MKCKIIWATEPGLLESRINAFIQNIPDVTSVTISICNGVANSLHYAAAILYDDWSEEPA